MEESAISNRYGNFVLLEEFLRCGTDIRHWVYSPDGELVSGNMDDVAFNQIFISTGCREEMLQHFRTSKNPVIMSTVLNIEWAAAYQQVSDNPDRIHVIGPVLNSDFDPVLFRAELSRYNIPQNYLPHLLEMLQKTPVLPTSLFFNYILMLNFAATGRHLERKDIIPLSTAPSQTEDGPYPQEKKSRQQVYLAEKALLDNVRSGSLNYRAQIDHASQLSAGVNSRSGPTSQSRISVIVFSSLCTRAAIEGGLSPELAYSIGDRYIQQASKANSVTGLQAIADHMYDEFIRTVHARRRKAIPHAQVRSCMDYIDANPEEDISLAALAERADYTEYYLSRKFRQETGMTVSEYLHRARTERAKLLLSTTTLPVYEIAGRLHYSSPTHFSDTFHKLTGMYPSEYRLKNQRL